ncbi:MAG TPA: endolytic transglycosylase MltG [Geobacteraceae bacterium]|nr:endolytic transglycosylase MltG [Geobacteraceae bacterium]
MKRYRVPLLIFLALLIIVPSSIYCSYLATPAGKGKNIQVFDFGQGQSLKKIAATLEERKVIGSAAMFVLYARLHGDAGRLKAGYYKLSDAIAPVEILRRMVAGEVYVVRFTVPEGYSIYQIAELISERRLSDREAFLRECSSGPLLRELGIEGKSVEGYLFPSTYDITPGMAPADIIRLMARQFEMVYERFFAHPATGSRLSKREIIILASLIEKEAVKSEERPLISSVFHNRLHLGMPLQSDPTAVYGVRAFAGTVSKKDISRATPYNTYLIGGLPPGPIGNPGSGAIEAAINPAKTDYLYFVAKKDGTHFFSKSLEEHNSAVRRYLKS